MKYKMVIVIVVIILFSCNENKSDLDTSQLPAHYISLTERLDSLYQQNSTNPSHQLTSKIVAIEKELLEKYPDLVSTDEDVNKEGTE